MTGICSYKDNDNSGNSKNSDNDKDAISNISTNTDIKVT